MSTPSHPALALRTADRASRVGTMDGARRAMRGEIWIVFHAKAGWTHLVRIDARDGRSVHLLRVLQGDRRVELSAWASKHLSLADALSQAA